MVKDFAVNSSCMNSRNDSKHYQLLSNDTNKTLSRNNNYSRLMELKNHTYSESYPKCMHSSISNDFYNTL